MDGKAFKIDGFALKYLELVGGFAALCRTLKKNQCRPVLKAG